MTRDWQARWLRSSLLALAALCTGVPLAPAQPPTAGEPLDSPPAETLLFARGNSLWRMPLPPYDARRRKSASAAGNDASSDNQAVELVRTQSSAITRIEVAHTGAFVIIETADGVEWATLPALSSTEATPQATSARPLDCTERVYLSPDAKCVACLDRNRNVALHRLVPTTLTRVHAQLTTSHLGYLDARRLVVTDQAGIWAISVKNPADERTQLAPATPSGPMLVSPDGKRAVAVFSENEGTRKTLYTFRLDGKGAKRRLLEDVIPISWSRDSQWVLTQRGKTACMVRATGGLYKCWRGFRAIALAPDGSYVLLARKARDRSRPDTRSHDLYRARRDGARPESPRPILRSITGPAVWLPTPP